MEKCFSSIKRKCGKELVRKNFFFKSCEHKIDIDPPSLKQFYEFMLDIKLQYSLHWR